MEVGGVLRQLKVTDGQNPWGLSLVRILARMAVLNVSRHKCHYLDGLYQTPTIPVMEASVAPIHVGVCGLIFLRCVGLAANYATRWRHKVSS